MKRFAAYLLFMVMAVISVMAAETYTVSSSSQLNVRTTPSQSGSVIGKMAPGTTANVEAIPLYVIEAIPVMIVVALISIVLLFLLFVWCIICFIGQFSGKYEIRWDPRMGYYYVLPDGTIRHRLFT